MRCAAFFVCAPLALCAQVPQKLSVPLPKCDFTLDTLLRTPDNTIMNEVLFQCDFLEALDAEDQRTPGDYTKFESILSNIDSDEIKQAFKNAVENSMVDIPVYGMDAVWKQELIDNPSQCLITNLFSSQMFEFFEFLALVCNKQFVNTLFRVVHGWLALQITILAACYNAPKVVERRFPFLAQTPFFKNVKDGQIFKIIDMQYFKNLHYYLHAVTENKIGAYINRWFNSITFDNKVAYYAECARHNYALPEGFFAALPVTADVFEALNVKLQLDNTIMLRTILSHTAESDIDQLRNRAYQYYNQADYFRYFKIALWMPNVKKLSIPSSPDKKNIFANALLNAKVRFLHPLKAKMVCNAFKALSELSMLQVFLWRYAQENVLEAETNDALALIWEMEYESLYTRLNFFGDESPGQSAARYVAAAHRASLQISTNRILNFVDKTIRIVGFDVAIFESTLFGLLNVGEAGDTAANSTSTTLVVPKGKFDAMLVLKQVKVKHAQLMKRHVEAA